MFQKFISDFLGKQNIYCVSNCLVFSAWVGGSKAALLSRRTVLFTGGMWSSIHPGSTLPWQISLMSFLLWLAGKPRADFWRWHDECILTQCIPNSDSPSTSSFFCSQRIESRGSGLPVQFTHGAVLPTLFRFYEIESYEVLSWPWTGSPPALDSYVLGLQSHATRRVVSSTHSA